jgi:hypothetical protein
MVVIEVRADRLELRAPYHPDLSLHTKPLGGLWRGQDIGWTFPHAQAEALRALCLRMWGVDGTAEALHDLVHLRVEVDEQDLRFPIWRSYNNPVYLVGREIAASLKSRSAARPGCGVKFLAGRPTFQTEVNAYWTTIPNRAVFLLMNTPRTAIDRFESALTGHGRLDVVTA